MTEKIRVTTRDLPDYKYPVAVTNELGYNLIQARDGTSWQPMWMLVDGEGTPVAIISADKFDDISADDLSQAAAEFIMDSHGLSEEDTGSKVTANRVAGREESSTYSMD